MVRYLTRAKLLTSNSLVETVKKNPWEQPISFFRLHLKFLAYCSQRENLDLNEEKCLQGLFSRFQLSKFDVSNSPNKFCSSKFRSKHSTNTVLCLLQNLLEQSLLLDTRSPLNQI